MNVGHSPCFYHLQKCTNRVQPRHDMCSTSICICYCDCRPWEGKKVLERRKEMSPCSVKPTRGKWQIGWSALIYIILHLPPARTMERCGLGNIQCMQNKSDGERSTSTLATRRCWEREYRVQIVFPAFWVNEGEIGHEQAGGVVAVVVVGRREWQMNSKKEVL